MSKGTQKSQMRYTEKEGEEGRGRGAGFGGGSGITGGLRDESITGIASRFDSCFSYRASILETLNSSYPAVTVAESAPKFHETEFRQLRGARRDPKTH